MQTILFDRYGTLEVLLNDLHNAYSLRDYSFLHNGWGHIVSAFHDGMEYFLDSPHPDLTISDIEAYMLGKNEHPELADLDNVSVTSVLTYRGVFSQEDVKLWEEMKDSEYLEEAFAWLRSHGTAHEAPNAKEYFMRGYHTPGQGTKHLADETLAELVDGYEDWQQGVNPFDVAEPAYPPHGGGLRKIPDRLRVSEGPGKITSRPSIQPYGGAIASAGGTVATTAQPSFHLPDIGGFLKHHAYSLVTLGSGVGMYASLVDTDPLGVGLSGLAGWLGGKAVSLMGGGSSKVRAGFATLTVLGFLGGNMLANLDYSNTREVATPDPVAVVEAIPQPTRPVEPASKMSGQRLSAPITSAKPSNLSDIYTEGVDSWYRQIQHWSTQYGVDKDVVAALMQTASCGNPTQETGLFDVGDHMFRQNQTPIDAQLNAQIALSTYAQLYNELGDETKAIAALKGGRELADQSPQQWPDHVRSYTNATMSIIQEARGGQNNAVQNWLNSGGASTCNYTVTSNVQSSVATSHWEFIGLAERTHLGTYYNPLREHPGRPVTNCAVPCNETRYKLNISTLADLIAQIMARSKDITVQDAQNEIWNNPQTYAPQYRPKGNFWFNPETRTAGIAAPTEHSEGTLIWTPGNNMLYAVIDTGGAIIVEQGNLHRYDILYDDGHTLMQGRGATYDTPKLWVGYENGVRYSMPATGKHVGVVVRKGWDGEVMQGVPEDVVYRADNILGPNQRILVP